MKELITMWKNTRMIVLTAVTAAIYAAVLIPFKVAIPIIPGFTEVRPANVIPIICSLMFGPAAAWGSAFGNLIGDFFGTLGLGSIFGFVGNFLYGYIPYRMWRAFGKDEPVTKSRRSAWESIVIALVVAAAIAFIAGFKSFTDKPFIYITAIFLSVFLSVFLVLRFLSLRYFVIILTASVACGVVIGWWVHSLGLFPFSALGNIIVLNNLIVSAVLGPLLLPVLYPVVKRLGLIYTDIMDERDLSRPRAWGSVLMVIFAVSGLLVGNWIGIGSYGAGILVKGFSPVLLFSKGLDYQGDLNNSIISEGLKQELEIKGVSISDKASVSTQETDAKWLIDDGYDKYMIQKMEDKLYFYVFVAGRGGLGLGVSPFILLIILAAAVM